MPGALDSYIAAWKERYRREAESDRGREELLLRRLEDSLSPGGGGRSRACSKTLHSTFKVCARRCLDWPQVRAHLEGISETGKAVEADLRAFVGILRRMDAGVRE
jgi:hypothetical protein